MVAKDATPETAWSVASPMSSDSDFTMQASARAAHNRANPEEILSSSVCNVCDTRAIHEYGISAEACSVDGTLLASTTIAALEILSRRQSLHSRRPSGNAVQTTDAFAE